MYAKNYSLDLKEKNLGVKEKLSLHKFCAKSSLPDRNFFKKRAQHPDRKIWTYFCSRAHRLTQSKELIEQPGRYLDSCEQRPNVLISIIIRCKNLADSKKGLLSRGATGWMLHFSVRNTHCLLNNMSFGIELEKAGHMLSTDL